MAKKIVHFFKTIRLWHFVWLSVVSSEVFTAVMSIILRGRITYDYLITGAIVSLIVSSMAIYFIKLLRKTEDALRESENRYHHLIDLSPDMIAIHEDGKFVYINESGMQLLGAEKTEQIIGRPVMDFVHPDYRKIVMERVRKGFSQGIKAAFIEERFLRLDETSVDVEVTGVPFAYQGKPAMMVIARDIIERKRAEEEKAKLELQLSHSQKMELIGTLTSHISHEFKNFLTTIIGYSEFLQEAINKDDPLRTYADMIHASATKAEHLTQGLLAYSRKQIINPKPVKLNAIVERAIRVLSGLIGEGIRLKSILTDEDVILKVDPDQIEQVLMNLCMNARDAMPEGGFLTLKTELIELDDEFKKIHGYGQPGRYALLSVTDTGIGMDEKTRQRIFEPFFTTKERGKGTGLGLAMVYGIIKQHDGYIDLDSEPGKGTSFKIFLPLVS